ncbi:MAG: hypothetical protein CMH36_00040 [Microbacterium sp.]|uniref:XRE family transcriptional regulator n=2 Tax=Microbacterium paludicola TaxID=300019 RepID=A0A4Y9FPA4_9MICO|nr:hypothetical protein [Microbacterium sp.]TFU30360.1 XRE family transcriptional regulator [Microbacterium paludicola]
MSEEPLYPTPSRYPQVSVAAAGALGHSGHMGVFDAVPDRDPNMGRARHRASAAQLSDIVYQARLAAGLSQEQAAQAAEISTETYATIERGFTVSGEPANPTLRTLTNVLTALSVDVRFAEQSDEM